MLLLLALSALLRANLGRIIFRNFDSYGYGVTEKTSVARVLKSFLCFHGSTLRLRTQFSNPLESMASAETTREYFA